MHTVCDFARWKAEGRKISMVTAYDAWTARLVARSSVDALLVGDSASMVMHGHGTTTQATTAMMAAHTRAVVRGAPHAFLVVDLPFLSVRQDLAAAVRAVRTLVASGANAVKVEGIDGHQHLIAHIVESGVPVMGHIGLTPQSVNQLGGFRVQGRTDAQRESLRRQAHDLQSAGCFAVVLECMPADLADRITRELTIPTIGIGAGDATDGQVLVLHDLWGIDTTGHRPHFVRSYCEGDAILLSALNAFDEDVKAGKYPSGEESYR